MKLLVNCPNCEAQNFCLIFSFSSGVGQMHLAKRSSSPWKPLADGVVLGRPLGPPAPGAAAPPGAAPAPPAGGAADPAPGREGIVGACACRNEVNAAAPARSVSVPATTRTLARRLFIASPSPCRRPPTAAIFRPAPAEPGAERQPGSAALITIGNFANNS